MKRTWYAFMVAAVLTVTFAGGCGNQDAATTTQGAEVKESGAQKQLTGTIEEVKDFMFIVTDQDGASYEFDFDETPEGLDGVSAGDQVTVTYTGTVSEVDPFSGTILSVQKK
ncbi:hypothetical protein [Eubacterium sp.]|uniref:hypothetical protein n=1 Tax=Eubacterium sp. TaxID=142586 RepID=UPI003AB7F1C4